MNAMDGNGQGASTGGGKRSVIDQGTTFNGPAVEVEAGGVLLGKAKVTELRSRGELAGEYDADDVELTGRVRDGTVIRAKALLVAPSSGFTREGEPQAMFGECQIEVGEQPSKEEAVARALANTRIAGEQPQPVARPDGVGPGAESEGASNGPGPRRKRTPSERPDTGA
jgi:hypothetical protein